MGEVLQRIAACVLCTTLFCFASLKTVGALQQGGYDNKTFWAWLKRKGNMQFNRLCVFALCLALASAVTALCFSFLGVKNALLVSGLVFVLLSVGYCVAEQKYALKVPLKRTGRAVRLFAVYYLFVAVFSYLLIAILKFLAVLNGSDLYGLIAYVPFAITPICLPFLLCFANLVEGAFEKMRNKKFVERAGQVLDETQITRVAVVGSFGKTSVKNILKTILSEKFSVVETPASYNTPIGVAKTVFSPAFSGKQVLIAEMGARKAGDIAELCKMVKPDYALFTGVCEQHISTFGSEENAFKEKSEILKCGAFVVCGEGLRIRVEAAFGHPENVAFADFAAVKDIHYYATETEFSLLLGVETVKVKTPLLGCAGAENILLAATLAYKMGLTAMEIEQGIAKIAPIEHRLQLFESGGIYILDDGYNCNPRGAKEALVALSRFAGRKCVVTPGIVECGVLEEKINGELGAEIARVAPDTVILVGETLVGAVKKGYLDAGGSEKNLFSAATLDGAKSILAERIGAGDAALFLNDLPDVY